MHTVRALAVSSCLILLVACSGSDTSSEPAPVEETAFGDMVGTMDKAHAVEGTVMQQKEDIDQALQESEGQ